MTSQIEANRAETLGVTGLDLEQTALGFTREPPPEIHRVQIPGHLGPDPNTDMVLGPKAWILTIFMARGFPKRLGTRFQSF